MKDLRAARGEQFSVRRFFMGKNNAAGRSGFFCVRRYFHKSGVPASGLLAQIAGLQHGDFLLVIGAEILMENVMHP